LFGIEEEEKDLIYSFHISIPIIFLIILHFKIFLLLLFGIEKEKEDCHKLYLNLSPPIFQRFPWSQRLQEALEKAFLLILVIF